MDITDYQQKSEQIIDKLALDDYQKDLLRQNWLSFIIHLERRISKNLTRYNILSTIGIIGGISIPAISSLSLIPEPFSKLTVSVLGVLTASSIAINQNQKYNEKWKHFRKMVEYARIEGENFLSLAGSAYKGKLHKEGFPTFMKRLGIIKEIEINTYFNSLEGQYQQKKEEDQH